MGWLFGSIEKYIRDKIMENRDGKRYLIPEKGRFIIDSEKKFLTQLAKIEKKDVKDILDKLMHRINIWRNFEQRELFNIEKMEYNNFADFPLNSDILYYIYSKGSWTGDAFKVPVKTKIYENELVDAYIDIYLKTDITIKIEDLFVYEYDFVAFGKGDTDTFTYLTVCEGVIQQIRAAPNQQITRLAKPALDGTVKSSATAVEPAKKGLPILNDKEAIIREIETKIPSVPLKDTERRYIVCLLARLRNVPPKEAFLEAYSDTVHKDKNTEESDRYLRSQAIEYCKKAHKVIERKFGFTFSLEIVQGKL